MSPNRKAPRAEDDLIDWFTVTYKSIYTVIGVVLAAAAAGGYYYYVKNLPPPPPPPQRVITQPTARFSAIEGAVKVKAFGTFEWVTADARMALKRNDTVRTGPGSAAEITFSDGTVVAIGPDSLMIIETSPADPGTQGPKVGGRISSGTLDFKVPPRDTTGGAAEISTPSVTARAESEAKGNVSVAPDGESALRVYEGEVDAKTKTGDTVPVGPNQQLKVDPSGKPGPTVSLPDGPVLLSPANASQVSYPDPTGAITILAWQSVPDAVSYRVLLDYNPFFNRPIVDRGDVKENHVEIRGLGTGKYYWKVAAVNRDGVIGGFSSFSRFSVVQPGSASQTGGQPPPLVIETAEARGNILQIKGKTEPGAAVTVNGQPIDVAANGAFNEYIQMEKAGRQDIVIKAVGINGGITEQRRSVLIGD